MRPIALLLATFAASALLGIEPSYARTEGPWCFHMTLGRDFVSNRCDFFTYEACRAEMMGLGGTYCTQNPYYPWNAKPDRKRRTKRSR